MPCEPGPQLVAELALAGRPRPARFSASAGRRRDRRGGDGGRPSGPPASIRPGGSRPAAPRTGAGGSGTRRWRSRGWRPPPPWARPGARGGGTGRPAPRAPGVEGVEEGREHVDPRTGIGTRRPAKRPPGNRIQEGDPATPRAARPGGSSTRAPTQPSSNSSSPWSAVDHEDRPVPVPRPRGGPGARPERVHGPDLAVVEPRDPVGVPLLEGDRVPGGRSRRSGRPAAPPTAGSGDLLTGLEEGLEVLGRWVVGQVDEAVVVPEEVGILAGLVQPPIELRARLPVQVLAVRGAEAEVRVGSGSW